MPYFDSSNAQGGDPPIVSASLIQDDGSFVNVDPAHPSAPPYFQDDLHSPPSSPLSTSSSGSGDEPQGNLAASGAAGAAVGLVVGGPILAALSGFATAHCAQKDGAVGDIARAMGDVALLVQKKAIDINKKHDIVEKSKVAASKGWEHAVVLDRQHRILDRIKEFIIFSWNSTVKFARDHRLLERGVEATGKGIEFIAQKFFGAQAIESGDQNRDQNGTPARTH